MSTEITIGIVARAHGVHGELYVDARTDEPERRFVGGQLVRPRTAGSGARQHRGDERQLPDRLTIQHARQVQQRWLISFAEISDRESAEALRGMRLMCDVPEDETPAGDDEYYDRQLVGLAVHRAAAGAAAVGTVWSVLHRAGQDVLEIRTDEDTRLVPFVAALVPDIDLAAGTVTVADVPGLLTDADTAGGPAQP